VKKTIVATTLLAALAACSSRSDLYPRVIAQAEPVGDEFLLAAPYVLALTIISADIRPSRFAVGGDRAHALKLIEFTAQVENLIKGDLPDRRISFFFFADPDQNPNYYLDPGKRYIVSLGREGGLLRTWADVTQLKIPIYSGKHDQNALPLNLGVGPTIAFILIIPGSDWDREHYGLGLMYATSYASPGYIGSLLKQVQSNPDRELRAEACLEAAQTTWYPNCLSDVLDSPNAGYRKLARDLLKTDGVNTFGVLKYDPLSLLPRRSGEYLFERLELYSNDLRPDVRQAACEDLRRMYPSRDVQACR
jgi:Prokaryotic membrane lipoprotein lipid attachment site